MSKAGKIKRLEISTPQGESGLLEKESRFVFNYTHPEPDREVSLIMPHRAESMQEVLQDEKHRVDGAFLGRMRKEWEGGCDAVGS